VASYVILRNGAPIATLAGSATSFTDSGLSSNTLYSYTLHATDAAGNVSPDATPASVTTRLAAPALSGVKNTSKSRGQKVTTVALDWNDIAGATGYYVYASYKGGAWTKTFVTGSSYTTGVLSSGAWSFKVTAYNANGESDFSNLYSTTV